MENKITVQPNYETHENFFGLQPSRQLALLSDLDSAMDLSVTEVLAYLELKNLKDPAYNFEVINPVGIHDSIELKCTHCSTKFLIEIQELRNLDSRCINCKDTSNFKGKVLEICSLNRTIKEFKLEDKLKIVKQEYKQDGFELTFDFIGFKAVLPLNKAYTFIYNVYREVEDNKLSHVNRINDLLEDFNGDIMATMAISLDCVPLFIIEQGETLAFAKMKECMQTGNGKTCWLKKDWETQKAEYTANRKINSISDSDILLPLRNLVTEFGLDGVLKLKNIKETEARDTIVCEQLGQEFEIKIKEAYTRICQIHE